MAKLVHFEASPRKERSHSLKAARAFIEAYREANPMDAVESVDLWTLPLIEFDNAANSAKFAVMGGGDHTPEQAAIWEQVKDTAALLMQADTLLFSVPMWNFGIPYKLKHFIDVVTQPGVTFTYSPEVGYTGLAAGKTAVVVYARGSSYAEGTGMEGLNQQSPYFETWLQFIGITDIRSFAVQPTAGQPQDIEKVSAEINESLVALAKQL